MYLIWGLMVPQAIKPTAPPLLGVTLETHLTALWIKKTRYISR
jgi:hypothetical protein